MAAGLAYLGSLFATTGAADAAATGATAAGSAATAGATTAAVEAGGYAAVGGGIAAGAAPTAAAAGAAGTGITAATVSEAAAAATGVSSLYTLSQGPGRINIPPAPYQGTGKIDQQVTSAEAAERARLAAAGGLQSTIGTGGGQAGATLNPATMSSHSLLGA